MGNYYKPTNDYMFKRIFGNKKNSNLLKDLLDSILPDLKIDKVEVHQQFSLEKELISDKLGILDILATLTDGTLVNIEMQITDYKNTVDRSLFYESGLFHEHLKEKEDYSNIPKIIGIWILDYNVFDIGPFHEIARLKRDYEDILLTDKLELHYIQLPKFKEKCERISSKLEQWLTFIINDNLEEIVMMNNKYVKKAEEELEYLNSDEKAIEIARLREKGKRDYEAGLAGAFERGAAEGRELGLAHGKEQGLAEGKELGLAEGKELGLAEGKELGIAEGKELGQTEKAIQIAKKMLEKGTKIEDIIEITGLTREEIEKL